MKRPSQVKCLRLYYIFSKPPKYTNHNRGNFWSLNTSITSHMSVNMKLAASNLDVNRENTSGVCGNIQRITKVVGLSSDMMKIMFQVFVRQGVNA